MGNGASILAVNDKGNSNDGSIFFEQILQVIIPMFVVHIIADPFPFPPFRLQSIRAAEEAGAMSSLGVDHATKLSAIPSQGEIYSLLVTTGSKLIKIADSLGDQVGNMCLKIDGCM